MTSRPAAWSGASVPLFWTLLWPVLALSPACADLQRGPSTTGDAGSLDAGTGDSSAADAPTDGVQSSFAVQVHGLLTVGCQGCHAAGGEAGDTRLLLRGDAAMDYPVVLPLVDLAAPTSSRLLTKMAGQGHGGGAVYAPGSPAYETIVKWIQQGAGP